MPTTRDAPTKPRRARHRILLTLGILASWVLGAMVVRLGLDWSDTFPYDSTSELRYLAVAVLALLIAIGGSVTSFLLFRRARKAERTE